MEKLPPSKEKIEEERVHLERELAKNKRRRTLMIVLFFLIPLAAIVASWQFGLIDGKTALVIAIAAGVAAGVGAGAVVGVAAVTGAVIGVGATGAVERLYNCEANLETRLASLSGLEQQEYMHRCPAIFQACQQDADCEAYRLAVAKSGRDLTVAEADMMAVWVDGANARESKVKLAREQQVACSMLRRTEGV